MALSLAQSAGRPMGELNTTPLIDVLLVLLVMFVLSIPAATHKLDYDLPRGGLAQPVEPVRNVLALDRGGTVLWNGAPIGDTALAATLQQVAATQPEPEVQFRPDPLAPYGRSAEVLRLVRETRVTRFGFAGTEQYRSFGK